MSTMTLEQLVATLTYIYTRGYRHGHESTVDGHYIHVNRVDYETWHADVVGEIIEEESARFANLTSREAKVDNGVNTKPIPTTNVKPNPPPAPPRRTKAAQPNLEPSAPYKCKFCGAPSHIEPQEQEAPVDYCHESNHGEPEQAVGDGVGKMPFTREDRYIVLKKSDLTWGKLEELQGFIAKYRLKTREGLVIEKDWPEYEPAWKMIEDRMTFPNITPRPAVATPEPLCKDEGCPHHGTKHVCVATAGDGVTEEMIDRYIDVATKAEHKYKRTAEKPNIQTAIRESIRAGLTDAIASRPVEAAQGGRSIYDQRIKVDESCRNAAPRLYAALKNLLDAVKERPDHMGMESIVVVDAENALLAAAPEVPK